MSGRGHASGAAIARMEHLLQIGDREFAAANLRERADNSTAHFVEETIPFDDEGEQRAFAHHVAMRQRADCRFHFVIAIRGERFEVVLAQQ